MSPAASLAVSSGFRDPVFGSQAVFRAVMDAFARPGTIADLAGHVGAPRGLDQGSAAILATLADADAPVFLEQPSEAAAAWLAFQTGAAPVDDPARAAFAVLSPSSEPSGWQRFSLGEQAYPDRAATLLLPVESLEGGEPLVLSGSGIEATRTVAPRGLPAGFIEARRANAALFPRGHDLVLVAGARILALPRTTCIERA